MQKSSNSLLHFTKNLDVIIAILNDKFYGSYCMERFNYDDKEYILVVPKICFCDIPEETITRYTHYGKYCIGLSKEWGKKKRINPVLYIENHSGIAESFIDAYQGTNIGIDLVNLSFLELRRYLDFIKTQEKLEQGQKDEIYDQMYDTFNKLERLSRVVTFGQYMPYYVKPYESDLIRKNETTITYRFYDEREWCYVPKELQTSNELYKTANEYEVWRKANSDKPLLEKVSLDFAFEDITHLIVENKEDLVTLELEINKIPSDRITEENRKYLKSVITVFGMDKIKV